MSGDRGRYGSETDKVICGNIEVPGKLRQGVGVRRTSIIILNETDVRTLEPRIVARYPYLSCTRTDVPIRYYKRSDCVITDGSPPVIWLIATQDFGQYPHTFDKENEGDGYIDGLKIYYSESIDTTDFHNSYPSTVFDLITIPGSITISDFRGVGYIEKGVKTPNQSNIVKNLLFVSENDYNMLI